ncbi:FAD:protein FMN transferase [Microbacterium sp. C7(2022)]|uniref:FAD:protein FMN transferase n=1 Tax=Microbacterium sp. C7(2022) TaxID=2992759 RepID=UPI00237A3338|nr:FAD:protein FMN transferase [Microbacterium sp. C7(2022)]MDE0545812.1 FAD:protein FMN transferase [Microbacterium sp. C7(2022)]
MVTRAENTWVFDAIGTRWTIDSDVRVSDSNRAHILALIDDFDLTWSRFRDDSVVSALSRAAGQLRAGEDVDAMFTAYTALSAATNGAVNPLVGESIARRGYDAVLSFVDRGAIPAPHDWGNLLSWCDGVLRATQPVSVDVGALGKGRLVDLVSAALARHPGAVTVDASGDVRVRGCAERIALEHPYDAGRAIGVWTVADAALCASAVNRRAWGHGLHHVLDARTGEPVDKVAATWAMGRDAMHADGAATALFFDGGPALAHEWGISWVRMLTDGRLQWSPGCDAELFIRA